MEVSDQPHVPAALPSMLGGLQNSGRTAYLVTKPRVSRAYTLYMGTHMVLNGCNLANIQIRTF